MGSNKGSNKGKSREEKKKREERKKEERRNREEKKRREEEQGKCKKITVGFVDVMGGSLSLTKNAINSAFNKGLFPSIEQIEFAESIPLKPDRSNLDQSVNSLESAVNELIGKGAKYIVTGGKSSILTPWIQGTAGNLNNLNAQQRHGDVFFMLTNIGSDAYKKLGLTNFGKLIDTFNYENLLQDYLRSNVAPGGSILFIYENGDTASQNKRDEYADAALASGIPFDAQPVNFIEPNSYNSSDMATALAKANALTPGSIVAIAVNGSSFHQDGFARQFNWNAVTSDPKFVGANFSPVEVSIPVDLFSATVPSTSPFVAPFIIANLGNFFSNTTQTTTNPLFIEGMGYFDALACHEIYYGFDGRSRFDSFNSYVNYWIVESVILAGTFFPVFSDIPTENPRWTQTTSVLPTPI